MHPRFLAAMALAGLATGVASQNCSNTSIGAVPLIDLVGGNYQGFAGGLYPGGNAPPPAHDALGRRALAAITPRDAAGLPAVNGKIVLVSIGMSNTTQEFSQFVSISDADPLRNPAVVVVDGAQGGQDARTIANPNAAFWNVVDQRLAARSVTPQQVQVAWVKEAVAGPTAGFPAHAQELRDLYGAIARILRQRFPNIQIAFYSSRIYAGYATTALNPEPYAYESGFGVRWMVEQQINGDPNLNYDDTRGAVNAPWLAWGPYTWADGLVPRSDGLIWQCSDFQADGTHPSTSGRLEVAQALDAFFTTNSFARPWYGGGGSDRAAALPYGSGCPASNGPLDVRTNSTPFLGNGNFRLGIFSAPASRPTVMFWSTGRTSLLFEGCEFLVDFNGLLAAFGGSTDASGRSIAVLGVPNNPSMAGQSMFVQWLLQDPGVSTLPIIGGGALSHGLELRFGSP